MAPEIDEHRKYLNDNGRVSAFAEAIAECVRPDDVVVDLGAGTGILGLFACRAGARRVYAIEQTGMIEVARAICHANGFDDRIVFLNAHSRHVDLPERVDVVMSDQIGFFGFDAGVLQFFADARERFLRPGGTLIPGRIDLCVAAVERPDMSARIAFWERPVAGFDMSAVRPWAANTSYVPMFSGDHLLTPPMAAVSIDLADPVAPVLRLDASADIARGGTLDGIGGWFVAQLSPHVTLSNLSGSDRFVDRWNVFFPVDRPVKVAEGDRVRVVMDILHEALLINWSVTVFNRASHPTVRQSAAQRFHQSMFRGMLISREDLRRTQPGSVPTLTPIGTARQSVLALCDGHRELRDIVVDVHGHHPMLFRTVNDAHAFVAKVIAENAR